MMARVQTMKRVAITGERRAELVEAPLPELRPGEVLVRVEAAPLCTEYRRFVAGEVAHELGHEAAGVVVDVAPPAPAELVGRRVVAMPLSGCGRCELCLAGAYIHCRETQAVPDGALAQYLRKPAWLALPLPDDVSIQLGALACCSLGPSFGALDALAVEAGAAILITGAGPVGLGAIVNARFRGLEVLVVEPAAERAELARRLGATIVEAHADGPRYGLECSGSAVAARLLVDAVGPLGKIAFVGIAFDGADLAVDRWHDLVRKGLTLVGSWHYNLSSFPRVLEVIRESTLVPQLIDAVVPFSQVQRAFELSASGTRGKVILQPWA
jgi:L-iditol 2-dehydrogenase